MKTTISAEELLASGDYLSVVRDFALSKGISLDKLLVDSNISLQDFISPPPFVPNFLVSRVGLNLYRLLNNPISDAAEFGLCMTASSHGSLGLAVQTAANLRDAYSIMTEFYNTRVNAQNIETTTEGDFLIATLVNKFDPGIDPQIQRFFDLATLVSIGTNTYKALDHRQLQGSIEIHVDVVEPDAFPFQKVQGVNVVFAQPELRMLMPKSWLDCALSVADPELSKVALAKCEEELKQLNPAVLRDRVKVRLRNLEGGLPTIDELATEFHMSTATFKRKLKEQHSTYQDLKNEARLTHAVELMCSSQETVENVAEILGYSDASNFAKAFKGWTGMSPKEYRTKHTSG